MSDNDGRDTREDADRSAYEDARKSVKKAVNASRAGVKDGYRAVRSRAHDARESAGEGFENNPLVALAGGLALGGIIGALLPRSKRETELLAGVGRSLGEAGQRAAAAARDAGTQKLDELGLSKEGAKDSVRSLIGAGREVAKTAGNAAGNSVKGGGHGDRGEDMDEGDGQPLATPLSDGFADAASSTDEATGGATVLGGDDDTTNFYEGDVAGDGTGDDRRDRQS